MCGILIHAVLAVAPSAWRPAHEWTARKPMPVFLPGNDIIQAAVNDIIPVSTRNPGVGTVALILLKYLRVHGRDVAEAQDGCQPPNRMLSRCPLEKNADSCNGLDFAPVTVEEDCQTILPGAPDPVTEIRDPFAVAGVHYREVHYLRQIAVSCLIMP